MAEAAKKKTPKAASGKKGKKGNSSRFLFFVKAMLIGIAVFCIALILAGALLLSPAPVLTPPGPLQPKDYRLQSLVLQQLMREMWNKDAPEISRFDFNDEEVRSLIRSADHGVQLVKMLHLASDDVPPPRYFQPEYHAGWLQFTYPWQALPDWFFGGCLKIRGEILLQKAEQELVITVRSAKIGGIPFPASWAERILPTVIQKQKNRDSWKRFDNLIQSLYYDPELRELVVIYRPAALRRKLPF